MAERRGTKGLELWCRKITEGYPGVKIQNMTSSWRDGLGFCAIIHHFRPDLIDFSKLNKDNIYQNNDLAFTIGEQYLGIPALLEAEDMVEYEIPDRLSIITYLAQFFQVFGDTHGSGARRVTIKRATSTSERPKMQQPSSSRPAKVHEIVGRPRSEPCGKCGLPVFITERVNVGKQLFHRGCFVCARCNSQLTLSNYYETENDNQYCCETCPDEEKRTTVIIKEDIELVDDTDNKILTAGLLDKNTLDSDNYSELFETALENNSTLEKVDTLSRNSDFTEAMSEFISSQLDDKDTPPSLPLTKPPKLNYDDKLTNEHIDDDNIIGLPSNTHSLDSDINNSISNTNQLTTHTAGLELEINKNINVTKDITDTFPQTSTPFVKNRKTFFENQFKKFDDNSDNTNNKLEMSFINITIDNKQINDDTKRSDSISNDLVNKDDTTNNDVILKITTDKDELSNNENIPDVEKIDTETDNEKIVDTATTTIVADESTTNKSDIKDLTTEYRTDLNSSEITDISINTDSEVSSPIKTEDISYNSTNPFEDDEDDDEEETGEIPEIISKNNKVPLMRKESYPEELNPFDDDTPVNEPAVPVPARRKRISLPKKIALDLLDDSQDDSVSGESPIVVPATKPRKVIPAARISLTPCWTQEGHKTDSADQKSSISRNTTPYSSNNSIPSTSSVNKTKKPNYKKNRKAPPPPSPSPVKKDVPQVTEDINSAIETEKENKDVVNENRRSIYNNTNDEEKSMYNLIPDKSTYGKWKRKKGPAPAKPIPLKRTVKKAISINEIKRELDIIELQLQGLEKQGVRLEQIIRDKCGDEWAQSEDSPISSEVEDLIVQLWDVIIEKNEICRKQTELIYLQKQQRLEEEHAELEYQIRCLLMQPEVNKTDSDKTKEEELIVRLLKVVEKRNEIVECLEMDRIREAAEDDSITTQLNNFTMKRDEIQHEKSTLLKKITKKHKKLKLKSLKFDVDKDIDETEVEKVPQATDKKKQKKKKKFNLF